MCWNETVSIQTFLFAIIVFFIGLFNSFPIRKLIFMIIFSNIQLVEYFLWKNIHKPKLNSLISKIGFFNISVEPIGACLLINNPTIRFYSIILYLILFSIYMFLNYKNINFYTTINKKKFLSWESLHLNTNLEKYYASIWFLFFFGGIILSKDPFIIFISFFTLIITLLNISKHYSLPSFWCSISNILWVYVLFYVIYKKFIL